MGLEGLDPRAFGRVIAVPFQGRTLNFIGREDFIATKVFVGGPMDLIDAARAITAAGASLDRELVRRLAQRFGKGRIGFSGSTVEGLIRPFSCKRRPQSAARALETA